MSLLFKMDVVNVLYTDNNSFGTFKYKRDICELNRSGYIEIFKILKCFSIKE